MDILADRNRHYTTGYWPQVPLLFAYGKRKLFQFHTQRWVDHVNGVPGGEVLAVDCGHWLQPVPEFTERLSAWLERTE
jgi:hypothetical protein